MAGLKRGLRKLTIAYHSLGTSELDHTSSYFTCMHELKSIGNLHSVSFKPINKCNELNIYVPTCTEVETQYYN